MVNKLTLYNRLFLTKNNQTTYRMCKIYIILSFIFIYGSLSHIILLSKEKFQIFLV